MEWHENETSDLSEDMFDFSELLKLNDPEMAKKCKEFSSFAYGSQVEFLKIIIYLFTQLKLYIIFWSEV